MKRVAGRLKIELSQFRDLEAFAQFGSDLDPDTQRTLARGERLVRMLNQNERSPLPVAVQVSRSTPARTASWTGSSPTRSRSSSRASSSGCTARRPSCWSRSAAGDWSDEVQEAVRKVVGEYAEDFGHDLDEEGQPLDPADDKPRSERVAEPEESAEPAAEPETAVA